MRKSIRSARDRERRSWVINGSNGPEMRLPLYTRKRTQVGHRGMSVSCQEATSFDHLVGTA